MNQRQRLLLGILFSLAYLNQVQAQVKGAFFAVHCDPPYAPFWFSLEAIVDSANVYNIPLTIMMSPPWADSVFSNPDKAADVAKWQSEGHEIAYHHHGITAKNKDSWDGYTNATNKEIKDEKLSPARKIGDMDDFMDFMEPLTGNAPITTAGIATETEWPAGIIYRAEGVTFDQFDVFSSVSTYTHNGFPVCGLRYANVGETSVDYAIARYETSDFDYAGLVTHAYNFVSDKVKRDATLEWFRFVGDKENNMTIREIMVSSACPLRAPYGQPRFQYDFSVVRDPEAVSNTVVLKINGAESEQITIRILDRSGRLISSKTIDITPETNEVEVSTNELNNGNYLIELSTKNFQLNRALIID